MGDVTSSPKGWKLFNVAMAAICIFAAAVQWNDPDPWMWIILYGLAAAVGFITLLAPPDARLQKIAPMVVGAMAVVGLLLLFPAIGSSEENATWGQVFSAWTMASGTVELLREAGGLLIVLVWMAVLLRSATRR